MMVSELSHADNGYTASQRVIADHASQPASPLMHTIDPVTAACHDHPYPYYLALQRGPALAWHAPLNLWVASRAAVIREVLEHPLCMVRPPAEAVPAALRGSPVGLLFSNLVRMNDGARHGPLKAVLRLALAEVWRPPPATRNDTPAMLRRRTCWSTSINCRTLQRA